MRGGRLRLRLISVLLLVGCLALVVTLHAHDGPEGGHDELDHRSSGGHHAVQVVGRLSISDPRIPQAPTDVAALYLTVTNRGAENDRLIGLSADLAASAVLHETVVADGRSSMRPLAGGAEIVAGGELVLEPGGIHGMLVGISRPLAVGEELRVTLEFEQCGVITLAVPVVDPQDAYGQGGH